MAIISNASDIHLTSGNSTNFTTSQQPFSITCWINAVWNPGSRRSMVGMYGPYPTPVTALQIGTGNGAGDLTCWTWGGTSMIATASGVMTPFNNTWVFVAYTYDGTTHTLYYNSVLVGTTTTAQIPGQFTTVYINGYPTGGTSEVHNHQIDAYSYFDRALSTDELLTMYNAGGARHGVVSGLLARYEFDELSQGSTVTSVVDMSGKQNTLTVLGAGTNMTYTYSNTYANMNLRMVQ